MEKDENISNNPFSVSDETSEVQNESEQKENDVEQKEEKKDDKSEKEKHKEKHKKHWGLGDKKLKEDYEKLNNQYIRLAADFDNFRKRQAQERESLISYGAEDAMKKFIEVLDNFDRAKAAIDKTDDVNQVKQSFEVLYKQMFDNLSKLGLELIKATGEEFDPNIHEAVMRTPTNEYEENHVIMELQKGYKFHDKVLRASLVNVAAQE